MSGDRFKIQDQQGLYYLTPTVVQWIDACLSARLPARQGRPVFTRLEYRDIIVNSLNHCVQSKGFVVNSWVIMSNHLHLIARVNEPKKLSDFLRDFKKFTSKAILLAIVDNPESRREWLLDKFAFEARRTRRAEKYKFWKDSNHADYLNDGIDVWEKINYIHMNPVRAGIVDEIDDYVYSSARDFAGRKGLVNIEVL